MSVLEECLIFVLAKAHQHVNGLARERLAPFGVTPAQYALLRTLWEHDGQSGAALCAQLRLDSASVTGLIDRLVQLGLVERRPDPADRRVSLVVLTSRGCELQEPLQASIAALNAELDATLSPANGLQLREQLRTLLAGTPPTTR